jgi:hypothetical protein
MGIFLLLTRKATPREKLLRLPEIPAKYKSRRKLLLPFLVVGLTCLLGVESRVAPICSGPACDEDVPSGKHISSSNTLLDLTKPVGTTIQAVSSATVEEQGTLTLTFNS